MKKDLYCRSLFTEIDKPTRATKQTFLGPEESYSNSFKLSCQCQQDSVHSGHQGVQGPRRIRTCSSGCRCCVELHHEGLFHLNRKNWRLTLRHGGGCHDTCDPDRCSVQLCRCWVLEKAHRDLQPFHMGPGFWYVGVEPEAPGVITAPADEDGVLQEAGKCAVQRMRWCLEGKSAGRKRSKRFACKFAVGVAATNLIGLLQKVNVPS